jgi:DNA mismatch repair protein MutS2
MAFSAGTEVIVVSLNRRGEIESCLRTGVYRVRVGGMTTTVREKDLREATIKKIRPAPRAAPESPAESHTHPAAGQGVRASLDLHGLTVDEARNRVAAYISRAILAGLDRVEIVHGIGTGRLKKAVTADLKKIGAVRRVTPHPTNPGALFVYL